MNTNLYKHRIIEQKIDEYLENFGAVCIEGAKWCGKTWTSLYHSKSNIMLGDPKGNFQNRNLAKIDPSSILVGDTPKLIDEWQEVPELWDAIRYEVDKRNKKGQFILTGSSTPNHKGIMHSGAGRIARLRMRPMSLYESGDSSGKVSLQDIVKRKYKNILLDEIELSTLMNLIVRGGWPASIDIDSNNATILSKEYINAIIEDDVFRIDGVKRDLRKMKLLLKSLARNESTTVTNKTLKNDIKEIDDEDINIDTVANYLDIFNRLFITDNQLPFSTNIRSSVRLKQAEKRHFVDPSLACALLGLNSKRLISDLKTAGFMFEALCERDLKIYAESLNAKLFHYQDYTGKEIDAVIETEEGEWIAFEIKLGTSQIEEAAKNLINLKKYFKKHVNANLPKSMCIICGMSNSAYLREDGIYVFPITALKP